MISRISIRCLSFAAAGLAVAFGVPAGAGAGTTIITGHVLSMGMRAVNEFTTSKNDDKPDSSSVHQQDLFQLCTGTKPNKKQGLYIFFSNSTTAAGCATPPNGGTIEAIDTSDPNTPFKKVATVGTLTIDSPLVQTTKNAGATVTAIKIPASISISCAAGATTADLTGVLDLKYASATKGGPVCPMSGSMHFTGSAVSPVSGSPEDFIIDDGSAIKINNRLPTIVAIP